MREKCNDEDGDDMGRSRELRLVRRKGIRESKVWKG
jgi:hypothetical protein